MARIRIPQSLAPTTASIGGITLSLLLLLLLCCAVTPTARAASSVGATAPVAHAASSCPNANLTPQPGNLGQIRAAILCLINQEREVRGESALAPNTKLTRAAQGHSEDMASGDYFSHNAPNGETPLERMRASGYIYSTRIGYEVGENIAWGTLWLASPQSIVNAWMASPGHRANILDARYRETGIGISPHPPAAMADGQAGALYTQDFGTIVTTGRAARHAPAQTTQKGSQARTSPKHSHHRGSARRSRAHRSSKHRSSGRSRRITSGARTTERSHKNYGSTRRQVRHRHRVRARHRARHRRTAHRARRAGAHQRSRRRHRHSGG